MSIALTIDIPSTASTTLEEQYAVVPPGTWAIGYAAWAPATAAAAGDGTNNANVTLATADGAGGAFTVIATLTGNAVAYAVDVARVFSTSRQRVSGGNLIRVAKTVTGTGGTIDGRAIVYLEKVN